jgi:hypothetical protein
MILAELKLPQKDCTIIWQQITNAVHYLFLTFFFPVSS